MRWLVDRFRARADDPPNAGVAPTPDDLAALDRLRADGSETAPHGPVVHVLGFARVIGKPNREVFVEERAIGRGWSVTVRVRQALTADEIGALRAEFEAVAGGIGGRYEGWSPSESATKRGHRR